MKSLFSLALLSAALLGLSKPSVALAQPAAAPAATLSPETVGKLLKLMAEKGADYDNVPAWVGTSLGFTVAGAIWPMRSMGITDKSGILHDLMVSRDSQQDFVFTTGEGSFSKIIYTYRVRRDGTLVTAVKLTAEDQRATIIPPAEAQKSLDAELAFWNSLMASPN